VVVPLRCPSCSGSLTTPRPAACPWCGSALPATPEPAPAPANAGRPAGPSGYGDARDLPRELPPLATPPRGSGGCLVVALVLAVLVAGAALFLGAGRLRPDDPPPPAPLKAR